MDQPPKPTNVVNPVHEIKGTRLYKTTRLFQYRYTSLCVIFQMIAYMGLLPLRYVPQEGINNNKDMPAISKDLVKKIETMGGLFDAWGVLSVVSFLATRNFFRKNVIQLWKLSNGHLQADTITLIGKVRKIEIPLEKLKTQATPYKAKTTETDSPLSSVIDTQGRWLTLKYQTNGVFKNKKIILDKDGLVENPTIFVNAINGLDFDYELPAKKPEQQKHATLEQQKEQPTIEQQKQQKQPTVEKQKPTKPTE
eukprot:TRINITY_DN1658_c0_g1_i3.p1 TRINITY_DN1658_c0_g1~~TRINITY_DN1658_c0_g1_i3.p1  ORF type:complete len:252 (-),score=60.84 TRINITY_DN1658_c0_g1_i3:31-786(-)